MTLLIARNRDVVLTWREVDVISVFFNVTFICCIDGSWKHQKLLLCGSNSVGIPLWPILFYFKYVTRHGKRDLMGGTWNVEIFVLFWSPFISGLKNITLLDVDQYICALFTLKAHAHQNNVIIFHDVTAWRHDVDLPTSSILRQIAK